MAKTPEDTAPKFRAPGKAAAGPGAGRARTGAGANAGAAKPAKPAKPARPAKAAAPAAAKAEPAAEPAVELRKKQLVERVVKATGAKKKVAREVLDAALAEIGEALSRGEGLNLPPLGKARVNRQKEKGAGEVLVLKLRRSGKDGEADESLADAAE